MKIRDIIREDPEDFNKIHEFVRELILSINKTKEYRDELRNLTSPIEWFEIHEYLDSMIELLSEQIVLYIEENPRSRDEMETLSKKVIEYKITQIGATPQPPNIIGEEVHNQ